MYDHPASVLNDLGHSREDRYVFMATGKGTTKKTQLSFFARKYKSGIKAINLDADDELIGSAITNGDDEILLASSAGKLIRFSEKKVRPMGRTARGVRGMLIKKDQQIISLMVANNEKEIPSPLYSHVTLAECGATTSNQTKPSSQTVAPIDASFSDIAANSVTWNKMQNTCFSSALEPAWPKPGGE